MIFIIAFTNKYIFDNYNYKDYHATSFMILLIIDISVFAFFFIYEF